MLKKTTNEIKHIAHSSYRCQYHIVFAPKYRRKEVYEKLKKDIGEILRKLCEQKGVEIIEAQACSDHIHMLLSIPPHLSIAQFMGFLKGKSSLMIFDRHANLKYKYGPRHFYCLLLLDIFTSAAHEKRIVPLLATKIVSHGITNQKYVKTEHAFLP